mmetsp:Transcript_18454/g.51777  ORF Transcript_18454/g.51777 Transcript_18454/m.51777 type:complete len:222 (-) Transcript_18454:456-1121(-)
MRWPSIQGQQFKVPMGNFMEPGNHGRIPDWNVGEFVSAHPAGTSAFKTWQGLGDLRSPCLSMVSGVVVVVDVATPATIIIFFLGDSVKYCEPPWSGCVPVCDLKQALQVDTHACLFKAFSHSTNGKSFIWIIASTWDPESLSCELLYHQKLVVLTPVYNNSTACTCADFRMGASRVMHLMDMDSHIWDIFQTADLAPSFLAWLVYMVERLVSPHVRRCQAL